MWGSEVASGMVSDRVSSEGEKRMKGFKERTCSFSPVLQRNPFPVFLSLVLFREKQPFTIWEL